MVERSFKSISVAGYAIVRLGYGFFQRFLQR